MSSPIKLGGGVNKLRKQVLERENAVKRLKRDRDRLLLGGEDERSESVVKEVDLINADILHVMRHLSRLKKGLRDLMYKQHRAISSKQDSQQQPLDEDDGSDQVSIDSESSDMELDGDDVDSIINTESLKFTAAFVGSDDGNYENYQARVILAIRHAKEDRTAIIHSFLRIAEIDCEALEGLSYTDFRREIYASTMTVSTHHGGELGGVCRENRRIVSSDGFTLSVPGLIARRLYSYQVTGLQWLYELYNIKMGGILGDEMGLGKTVQIAAFLASLCFSDQFKTAVSEERRDPRILIIVPATVMHQWYMELTKWNPLLFVGILHSAGSQRHYRDQMRLLQYTNTHGGVVVTTYAMLRAQKFDITGVNWEYIVLDEGHKIKNPDSSSSLICKQLKSRHRIILSGTPVQNNLKELWSLFDFVCPGKLGTLPVFMSEFSRPIQEGGFANASPLSVQTAYACACILKRTISPYILRRMKKDVLTSTNYNSTSAGRRNQPRKSDNISKDGLQLSLPDKREHILFCKLSPLQTAMYKAYIESSDVQKIIVGQLNALAGIDVLRKICNHPKLASSGTAHTSTKTASITDSGKMVVLQSLLAYWKSIGSKVLIFCQTRQMVDILEPFVLDKYNYLRMDGTTPISKRPKLIDQFNNDDALFVFLLTTKVGGLGINLTGANCIVIFDPDWNPSTDMQARERAWRPGQTRNVTIYRLLTAGTIEEKIYNRQVYKQFLTARVLTDPTQKRFATPNDVYDLFTYGSDMHPNAKLLKKIRSTFLDNDTEFNNVNGIEKQEIINYSKLPTAHSNRIEDPDEYILEELFKDTNVLHSIIDHEKMIDSPSDKECFILEQEAAKIASHAERSLNLSIKELRRKPVNIPTFTGSMKSLIEPSPPMSDNERITAELIKLFNDHTHKMGKDKGLTTQEIVAHFNLKLNANKMDAFRTTLKEIASFIKKEGVGVWFLR